MCEEGLGEDKCQGKQVYGCMQRAAGGNKRLVKGCTETCVWYQTMPRYTTPYHQHYALIRLYINSRTWNGSHSQWAAKVRRWLAAKQPEVQLPLLLLLLLLLLLCRHCLGAACSSCMGASMCVPSHGVGVPVLLRRSVELLWVTGRGDAAAAAAAAFFFFFF